MGNGYKKQIAVQSFYLSISNGNGNGNGKQFAK